MREVFLAHSFQSSDRELVSQVQTLLESHGLRVLTGRRAGGGEITAEVKRLIEAADGLVALLTRREEKTSGGWTTHDWVQYELNHARDDPTKRTIAIVEEGVDPPSVYGGHERLDYSRPDAVIALLALSETVGLWKRDIGRLGKIRILPAEAVERLNHGAKLQYCLIHNGRSSQWQSVEQAVPEIGGTFLYISGIRDETQIRLAMQDGPERWESVATPPWISVELAKRRGPS